MTSSFLGGIVTPPSPSSSFVTFWLPPPQCARNSRHNWFRDKTAYVGLLTIVEGPSRPGTTSPVTLNVTFLSYDKTKHIYSFRVRVEMIMSSFVIFWLIPPLPLRWWRHLWTAPYPKVTEWEHCYRNQNDNYNEFGKICLWIQPLMVVMTIFTQPNTTVSSIHPIKPNTI